jgi:hypothetical protein
MIFGLLVRRVELSDKGLSNSLFPECSSKDPEVSEVAVAMILRIDFAHLESRAMRFLKRQETCKPLSAC